MLKKQHRITIKIFLYLQVGELSLRNANNSCLQAFLANIFGEEWGDKIDNQPTPKVCNFDDHSLRSSSLNLAIWKLEIVFS